ncbi:MAG: hypothetical protein AAF467_27550 [Actinomycetota bacterium]
MVEALVDTGARTGTETSIAEAASYRVVSWARGFARSATCDGPGDPVGFTCSVAGGTLRWTDQGVSEYYIRLVASDGTETYLGASTSTSIEVPPAAGYKVIHWVGGRNEASCAG